MKKLLLTIILTSFVFTQTDGEVIKNVTAAQRTDGSKILDITYDLEPGVNFTYYRVYVSIEDGAGNEEFLIVCTGDVWETIFPGNGKQIECQLDVIVDNIVGNVYEAQNISGNFSVNSANF